MGIIIVGLIAVVNTLFYFYIGNVWSLAAAGFCMGILTALVINDYIET